VTTGKAGGLPNKVVFGIDRRRVALFCREFCGAVADFNFSGFAGDKNKG